MGFTDVPPPGTPAWLVPGHIVTLGAGVTFWLAAYVLMVQRSLRTGDTPVPILALGLNLAWEVVYALYVTETSLEFVGFGLWLVLDLPVLYATLKTAPRSFASQPLAARAVPWVLGFTFLLSVAANFLFVWWWLKDPHRGYGLKFGKTWHGMDARDTTELSWWSAGFAQAAFSVGALAMLVQRGHSGGQSYGIW